MEVVVGLRQGEDEACVGEHLLGIAAVELVAGEPGFLAKVLLAGVAPPAFAAAVAQPRDAHPGSGRKLRPSPGLQDFAGHLVARDDRAGDVRELAVDDVQIGAAHATGPDPDPDLARPGRQAGPDLPLQGLPGCPEHHGFHGRPPGRQIASSSSEWVGLPAAWALRSERYWSASRASPNRCP